MISQAERSPEFDEPLAQLGRLDRFGHGRDRYPLDLGEPERSPLPPTQMWEGEDHAVARIETVGDMIEVVDMNPPSMSAAEVPGRRNDSIQ